MRGLWVALLPVLLGCPHVPAKTGALAAVDNPNVTTVQLGMRVYETGRRASATIEIAADSIRSSATARVVRERALLWKITAIPLVQDASLRSDPVIAAVDLWAFAIQQRSYFRDGDGRQAFGLEQQIAVSAADSLEREARDNIARIWTTNTIPLPIKRNIEVWAEQHPMYGPQMRRVSVLAADWKALGVQQTSFGSELARMGQALENANDRLGYLNEGLFRRLTWQSELVVSGAALSGRMDTLTYDMSFAARAIGAFTAAAPATFDAERRDVVRDLEGMRERVFASIDAQRVATLDALRAERIAIGDDLDHERIAALAQADSIAQRSIERTDDVVRRLVRDAALLLASLIVLAGVVADVVIGRARRDRTVRA